MSKSRDRSTRVRKSSRARPRPAEARRNSAAAATAEDRTREGVPWAALGLLAALAFALFARSFAVGFAGDDYVLLDAARRLRFLDLLGGREGIPGFYRPVSRELYFWLWGRTLELAPIGYHVVNATAWAGSCALYFWFVRRWLGNRSALHALAAFVVFPPVGALLTWISCAQDLIALFWCAAALVLYQGGRHLLAGVAVALAALSKETAVPFALALVALDGILMPSATGRERLVRLRPAFAGLAASLAVAVLVRASWPAGLAVAVWSPSEVVEAWRLPAHLASSFAPPHTLAGIAAAWRDVPLGLALPAIFAFAVPFAAPVGLPEPARTRARGATRFAIVVGLLGMIPVAVIVERWRGYYFSIAALGTSLLLGLLLARLRPWMAAAVLAGLALVSYGSNAVYRPLENAAGPGRHPHANVAFFRDAAAVSGQLLSTLEPLCDSLRAVRRTVALDLPPGVLFDTAVGPALRVTCRDTTERVVRLEAFRATDAVAPLALLWFDPSSLAFAFRRAGASEYTMLADSLRARGRRHEALACDAAARRLGDTTAARPLIRANLPVRP